MANPLHLPANDVFVISPACDPTLHLNRDLGFLHEMDVAWSYDADNCCLLVMPSRSLNYNIRVQKFMFIVDHNTWTLYASEYEKWAMNVANQTLVRVALMSSSTDYCSEFHINCVANVDDMKVSNALPVKGSACRPSHNSKMFHMKVSHLLDPDWKNERYAMHHIVHSVLVPLSTVSMNANSGCKSGDIRQIDSRLFRDSDYWQRITRACLDQHM